MQRKYHFIKQIKIVSSFFSEFKIFFETGREILQEELIRAGAFRRKADYKYETFFVGFRVS